MPSSTTPQDANDASEGLPCRLSSAIRSWEVSPQVFLVSSRASNISRKQCDPGPEERRRSIADTLSSSHINPSAREKPEQALSPCRVSPCRPRTCGHLVGTWRVPRTPTRSIANLLPAPPTYCVRRFNYISLCTTSPQASRGDSKIRQNTLQMPRTLPSTPRRNTPQIPQNQPNLRSPTQRPVRTAVR